MDDCLPLESLSAASLRMLLAQARVRQQELEQEISRLSSGLARQNERILALERRETERQRAFEEQERLLAGVQEQNALLRRQAAQLHQENARLRGITLGHPPDPAPEIRPAPPVREPKTRKKRAPEHNAGRRVTERANRWMDHAAEICPRCGTALAHGWIQRRIQVIDLPPTAPLEITCHRIIRRQCPQCGRRVLPEPVGLSAGRIGRCRFGPRLMAAIAVMATVERLPGRQIADRLWREYGLHFSHGAVCGLLRRMADEATPVYEQLANDVRGSPAVHADETGWRQNGQHTFIWTFSTRQTVYVHHGSRSGTEVDAVLGTDFAGVLVSDFYAAYDHLLTSHQRCWRHLWADLEELLDAHADDSELVAWAEGIGAIWKQATAERPAAELSTTSEAAHARAERARCYEQQLLALCPETIEPPHPHATLAKRIRRYGTELFTFVRELGVDATNNAAERSLRPLVIARKISGGTRSGQGSQTRMILYSVCATARIQGKDPAAVCQQILLAPPDAPSPLTASTTAA